MRSSPIFPGSRPGGRLSSATAMRRNLAILLLAALVTALPFALRRPRAVGAWREGDPVLVVISPHIASIREEFERGFSAWHLAHHGAPVRIDWRNIGGTTEIMRYLQGELDASFRAWWSQTGHASPPDSPEARAALAAADNPDAFTTKIDVFFGGGSYDHGRAERLGLTVRPWPEGAEPPGVLRDENGRETFPAERGGEVWRDGVFYSAVLSAFGICHNPDRLRDLGITEPPVRWRDLADPLYFGQIGVTDPTKSGSIAKAFEMIVHSECHRAVRESGFSREDVLRNEEVIAAAGGTVPPALARYQAAVERGWKDGIDLVRLIGANARYFTDGASKVALDVSSGDAAAGITIDFYARVQADVTRDPTTGRERMAYVTPEGGSSVSGDPISLLRGAPHRELAARFLEYVLGPDGQRLWNYRPGEPGGPARHALRRLPVRREYYPAGTAEWPSSQGGHSSQFAVSSSPPPRRNHKRQTANSELQTPNSEPARAAPAAHAAHTSDPLSDPAVDAYRLSGSFDYVPRWTAAHFGFLRLLVRSMCMDARPELKDAWRAIASAGGPAACPAAMQALLRLPPGLDWTSAPVLARGSAMDLSREWTIFFRDAYREAAALAVAP